MYGKRGGRCEVVFWEQWWKVTLKQDVNALKEHSTSDRGLPYTCTERHLMLEHYALEDE